MRKKIYKILEDGSWGNYEKVIFPDGEVMDENNHNFEKDGFFWSEEPPKEYLDWLKKQNNNEEL